MNICFDEKRGVFRLDTKNSSYVMALADGKWLGHVYYGKRIGTTDLKWVLDLDTPPFTPDFHRKEETTFFDCFPMEYPVANMGDARESCLEVRTKHNQFDCLPVFTGYEIIKGKPGLEGLPATFGNENECNTLKLTLSDKAAGIIVELLYTAFTEIDVITRSVIIRNVGGDDVWIERVLSAGISLPYENQQYITLPGSWARERSIQVQEIGTGYMGTASKRGISSHQDHPFIAVTSRGATQEQGEVYAMHFVYSGNFIAQIERSQHDQLRMVMGINPYGFCWKLEPGEHFQAPEVVMSYSGEGLGKMTRTFHELYREHIIRSKYKYTPRPVLINNWEATYYNFNEDKLLGIAEKAASLGIELFVLDDGWFKNRSTDSGGLGDWIVDTEKLPDGLAGLSEKLKKLGLKFGLWMEPEMAALDSELYRSHPDWVIHTRHRQPLLCRDQFVLDLSDPKVEEYVYSHISRTLKSADISYLKWDMNRPLANLGSDSLPDDRQGELSHRYVLALYRLQERLLSDFPDLLLENCCSGGGRFDPGMLYYCPQIWCSDDTDAIERLRIQEGTAMLYPLSCIGAHVSACPNHLVGRNTPFETRGIVAMSGTFGYELDVNNITLQEQKMIPEQISQYKKYAPLILSGDYYRLSSLWGGSQLDAQIIVSKDRSHALVTMVRVLGEANRRRRNLRLQGLDPKAVYRDMETGAEYSGDALLYIGLPMEFSPGDFQARQVELRAVK